MLLLNCFQGGGLACNMVAKVLLYPLITDAMTLLFSATATVLFRRMDAQFLHLTEQGGFVDSQRPGRRNTVEGVSFERHADGLAV